MAQMNHNRIYVNSIIMFLGAFIVVLITLMIMRTSIAFEPTQMQEPHYPALPPL